MKKKQIPKKQIPKKQIPKKQIPKKQIPKKQIVPNELHYLKVCQALVSSMILKEDFSQHLDAYREFGPEAIEEAVGELIIPLTIELDLVTDIVSLFLDDSVCNHCVLGSSIEIDNPYIRRRHYRIAEFFMDDWQDIEISATRLANSKEVDLFLEDQEFFEKFMSDQEFFDESVIVSEEEDDDETFSLQVKKEIKMLN